MNTRQGQPYKPTIVYTDLDGTLLDHETYSFADALPALNKLKICKIPLVVVTSKTMAEVLVLVKKMDLHHPVIVENGSAIAFPLDYFDNDDSYSLQGGYLINRVTETYASIVEILNEIKQDNGYAFEGFSDMTAQQVVNHTGLSITEAENAKKRSCTEPLIWRDSESHRLAFEKKLALYNLTLVKGGRFWHVMGDASKGNAIQILNKLYQDKFNLNFTTIGLGDSPNDISMLNVVDCPVVVKSIEGRWMEFEAKKRYVKTEFSGPKGWNEFILNYLVSMENDGVTN
ncbi:MAG: HAD-IIB family hydrolase, partial [Gammaproteobacteria bacterium]|nr:HAD-IIB family hydrolase [Gammaproteobacteria bacterium]